MGRDGSKLRIRWMGTSDWPRILEIERESFLDPWTQDDFAGVLRNRNGVGRVAVVGRAPAPIAAFVIYEFNRARTRVLNLAVAEAWRRRGIGRELVGTLVADLVRYRRSRITLEVRETNLPAQLFFRAMGFRAVSVLRGFYGRRTPEDAYLMVYRRHGRVAADGAGTPQRSPR